MLCFYVIYAVTMLSPSRSWRFSSFLRLTNGLRFSKSTTPKFSSAVRPLCFSREVAELKLLSEKLVDYVRQTLSNALSERISRLESSIDEVDAHEVADELLKLLLNNPIYAASNEALYSAGTNLAKGLKVLDSHLLEQVLQNKASISTIIQNYEHLISKNTAVFNTITSHHHNITQKEWQSAVQDQQSLEEYKDAATAMGNKTWVREGNQWMVDFLISYYRHGTAKKHYMRKMNLKKHDNSSIVNTLSRDLMLKSDERKIKVLDVGSCYNPFVNFPQSASLDVTAIDLRPSNPSVLRCDFLALQISPEDSLPIYGVDGQSLEQLPAKSFDAVCMSLVLSYLPSPAQRAAMVNKARQLLRYNYEGAPHYNGLLLIMEKDSIFPKSTNNPKLNIKIDENNNANMPFESMAFKHANGYSLRGDFRRTIEDMMFETVKYTYLKSTDNRWMHCFAFGATASNYSDDTIIGSEQKMLWIRQDMIVPPQQAQQGTSAISNSHENTSSTSAGPDTASKSFNVLTAKDRHKQLVAIIGGGLGGAALAVALHRRNHPYILFERDASFDSRRQGYALTMQQAGTALRLLGLQDEVAKSGVRSVAHYAFDDRGKVLGAYGADVRTPSHLTLSSSLHSYQKNHHDATDASKGSGRHNIHIPRQVLRKLLVSRLPPDTIQWSSRLVHLENQMIHGEGSVHLGFDNGQEVTCAVAVGADGIFSQTRRLFLPPEDNQLRYLGLIVVLGISPSRSVIEESSKAYCQRQWLDGETRVFSMPFDNYHSLWQLSYPLPEEIALQLSSAGAIQTADIKQKGMILKQQALLRLSGWDSTLRKLIETTPDDMISGHPVYDRDPTVIMGKAGSIAKDSRVTLIGDAAHPMSPFKGQGANQALLDALNLDKALRSSSLTHPSRRPVCEALRAYEAEMVHRSAEKVQKSQDAAIFLHSPAALAEANITRAKAAEIAAEQRKVSAGA